VHSHIGRGSQVGEGPLQLYSRTWQVVAERIARLKAGGSGWRADPAASARGATQCCKIIINKK
jgi:hypothetical protein